MLISPRELPLETDTLKCAMARKQNSRHSQQLLRRPLMVTAERESSEISRDSMEDLCLPSVPSTMLSLHNQPTTNQCQTPRWKLSRLSKLRQAMLTKTLSSSSNTTKNFPFKTRQCFSKLDKSENHDCHH